MLLTSLTSLQSISKNFVMFLGLGLCRLGKSSFSNECSGYMLCLLEVSLYILVIFLCLILYCFIFYCVLYSCPELSGCPRNVVNKYFPLQLSSLINPINDVFHFTSNSYFLRRIPKVQVLFAHAAIMFKYPQCPIFDILRNSWLGILA